MYSKILVSIIIIINRMGKFYCKNLVQRCMSSIVFYFFYQKNYQINDIV